MENKIRNIVLLSLVLVFVISMSVLFLSFEISMPYLLFWLGIFTVLLFFNLESGLFLLILIRPMLDVFSEKDLISLGGFSVNPASYLAVLSFILAIYVLIKHYSKLKKEVVLKNWIYFLAALVISAFFSINKPISFFEIIRILSIFSIFCCAVFYIDNLKKYRRLLNVILFSSIVPIFFSFYQLLFQRGVDIPLEGITNRIFGTFAHPNSLAFYMFLVLVASIILISLRVKKKRDIMINLIFSAAAFLILIFTFTRGAWLAFFLFLLTISFFRYKKLSVVFIIGLVLVFYVSEDVQLRLGQIVHPGPDSSVTWRIALWKDSFGLAFQNPLLGFGPGTVQDVILDQRGPSFGSTEPHNDFLRVLLESGIIGLGAYVFLYTSIIKRFFKKHISPKISAAKDINFLMFAFLITVILMSFGDNVLRNTAFQWSFWALIGATLNLNFLSSRHNSQ